jgi:hypothetical protein
MGGTGAVSGEYQYATTSVLIADVLSSATAIPDGKGVQ